MKERRKKKIIEIVSKIVMNNDSCQNVLKGINKALYDKSYINIVHINNSKKIINKYI